MRSFLPFGGFLLIIFLLKFSFIPLFFWSTEIISSVPENFPTFFFVRQLGHEKKNCQGIVINFATDGFFFLAAAHLKNILKQPKFI